MTTLFRILGYLSIPVLLVSVGFTIRSIRREQRVAITRRSLILPMLMAAAVLLVYAVFLDVSTTALTTWLPLTVGIVAGWVWCHTATRLTVDGGRVLGAKTVWVLVPWVLSMLFTQVLALTQSTLTVPVGFSVMFAVGGLAFGEHAGLLRRRAVLLGGGGPGPPAASAAAVAVLVGLIVLAAPGLAEAKTYDFEKIANGEESYVTAETSGSGRGYYGDSLSTFIRNDTGRTITVVVATGLRLVPEDPAAQTMLTVGQTFEVPPGGAARLIKAFCGEMHDRAPGAGDTFHVRGRVGESMMRGLLEIKRKDMGDSSDAQDFVWSLSDGHSIEGNQAAQDLRDGSRRTPLRRDAEESAAVAALIAGGAATGISGTGRRRLLLGPHALKRLTLHGAGTRTIEVIDPETGERQNQVFVLPPAGPPSDAEAMAFTTKSVTDPATGGRILVIDDEHEVQLLLKPLVPPRVPDAPAGTEPAEPVEPAGPAEPAEPAKAVRKVDDDEVKRIVEWGVKNNRTPDDIQRDLDVRNESLGGSGAVPMPEPLKRVTLLQGEVTLTNAEYLELRKRAGHLADNLSNVEVIRSTLEALAKKSHFWSTVDRATVVRWIAGTKQIYDQGLRMNHPEQWLARKGGHQNVEEMLTREYGKPTWMSYDTRHHASLTDAVEAWRQERGGGWDRLQTDRSRVIEQARKNLRTMMPETSPTPETPTLPERVFVGPRVEAPRLFPKSSPAVNKMSWLNRPVHELKDVMKAQQRGTEYLRGIRHRMDEFLEYEANLARRIRRPGD